MLISHPVHVPVQYGRALDGTDGYSLLQWAERIYKGTKCEVFMLRILSLALACHLEFSKVNENQISYMGNKLSCLFLGGAKTPIIMYGLGAFFLCHS